MEIRAKLKVKMDQPYCYIYCDMDQVLVNFLRGARQVLGKEFNDLSLTDNDSKWREIALVSNFWHALEWMPNARKLWGRIMHLSPFVLTACPTIDPNASGGKKDWCRRNLQYMNRPFEPDRCLTVMSREAKLQYARHYGQPNILIDDHPKTIDEWNKAGGIGLLHHTVPETIKMLDVALSCAGDVF